MQDKTAKNRLIESSWYVLKMVDYDQVYIRENEKDCKIFKCRWVGSEISGALEILIIFKRSGIVMEAIHMIFEYIHLRNSGTLVWVVSKW